MRTALLLLLLLALAVPTFAETGEGMVEIVDSYVFDEASLTYHPAYEERVRHTYSGGFYYEHVPRPESWSFDILRAGRQIPCKILCTDRGDPEFTMGENMPMGVIRYLQKNICDKKESFRQGVAP